MTLAPELETMLLDVLDGIIARCERGGDAYPFIDTKLDIATGRDFADGEAYYRRREIIFPWIQGRGLEALAGHLRWLDTVESLTAAARRRRQRQLRTILARTAAAMEKLRRRNRGRLFFMMTPDGQCLEPDGEGDVRPLRNAMPEEANFSDLFYSKGLFAAGAALGDRRHWRHGENYLRRTVRAIVADRFRTDQQSFDPKNPVTAVPGKLLQGPKMIALGGSALGLEIGDRTYWERRAIELIRQLFDRYINADGRFAAPLQRYDYWEAANAAYQPWIENGVLLADPGHSLEFIGLSLKNLLRFESPAGRRLRDALLPHYPAMLKHYFELGFNAEAGGIAKSVDLLSRRRLNTDMPWWSLPETIRAAALCLESGGDEAVCRPILAVCADALLHRYVNPACHRMACQTRSAQGEIIEVIPATPDADPGYHTGLSIIDALPAIREFIQPPTTTNASARRRAAGTRTGRKGC